MEPIIFTISCKKKVGQVDVEYSVQRDIPTNIYTGASSDFVETLNKEMEASLNRLTEENT